MEIKIYRLLWTDFTCLSFFTVDFEQVSVGWEA